MVHEPALLDREITLQTFTLNIELFRHAHDASVRTTTHNRLDLRDFTWFENQPRRFLPNRLQHDATPEEVELREIGERDRVAQGCLSVAATSPDRRSLGSRPCSRYSVTVKVASSVVRTMSPTTRGSDAEADAGHRARHRFSTWPDTSCTRCATAVPRSRTRPAGTAGGGCDLFIVRIDRRRHAALDAAAAQCGIGNFVRERKSARTPRIATDPRVSSERLSPDSTQPQAEQCTGDNGRTHAGQRDGRNSWRRLLTAEECGVDTSPTFGHRGKCAAARCLRAAAGPSPPPLPVVPVLPAPPPVPLAVPLAPAPPGPTVITPFRPSPAEGFEVGSVEGVRRASPGAHVAGGTAATDTVGSWPVVLGVREVCDVVGVVGTVVAVVGGGAVDGGGAATVVGGGGEGMVDVSGIVVDTT